MLLLQIASYNSNTEILPSIYANSAYPMPEDVIVKATLNINLVMIGEDWGDLDKTAIADKLLKSYTPQIASTSSTAGVKYDYQYQFIDASNTVEKELFEVINNLGVGLDAHVYFGNIERDLPGYVPDSILGWLENTYPEYELILTCSPTCGSSITSVSYILQCATSQTECLKNVPPGDFDQSKNGYVVEDYKIIMDVYKVEEILAKNYSNLEGYTLIFLNPSKDQIPYYHTYGVRSADPVTDTEFMQEGMMGFGGSGRFYFIDLSAGPWIYPYAPFSDSAMQFHQNRFTVSIDDYQDFIAEYTNNAIRLLFTPSYLYEPLYNVRYSLDILLIDQTGGRSFADIAKQYVSMAKIENAMVNLLPYTEWEITVDAKGFDFMPRDLQRAMIRSMEFVENTDVVIIRSEDLIVELDKFIKSQLTSKELEEKEEEGKRTTYLPVTIFISEPKTYVDDYGSIGIAAPDPSDKRNPCCAIVTIDKKTLEEDGVGLTDMVIHEVGHLLGLRHPHDGIDENGELIVDWFFDWSNTPMTYSSPSSMGCGLSTISPCGMVHTEYGKFDFDTLHTGLVLYLLRASQSNVYEAISKAEALGYSQSNLPLDVTSLLEKIDRYYVDATELFIAMNYFDTESIEPTDAFGLANNAFVSSSELLEIVKELSPYIEEEPVVKEESVTEESVTVESVTVESVTEKPKEEEPRVKSDISVVMKHKKKVTLVAVKNNGGEEVFGVQMKIDDGKIRFVKARGWDRDRIDQDTVLVQTIDKPIKPGKSLICILIVDNRNSSFEWIALDSSDNIITKGNVMPKS